MIETPIRVGTLPLKNRLYRAPVLEGAGSAPDPAAVYRRHFVPNAAAGVGLVVQGNTVVLPFGRTSPGMSAVAEAADLHRLASVPAAVHDAGGRIVVQLGHGGLFALESWHADFDGPVLAASRPPWWLRATHRRVSVLSTRDVGDLVARFGLVARWAKEAGYDGVQLAGGNAKLLHQFLSPTFNRRADRYADGTVLLRELRDAIAASCGPDFPVLLKYCAREVGGPGRRLTLERGVAIARAAEDAGFHALTPASASQLPDTALCRGRFPAASFHNPNLRRALREAAGWRLHAIEASMWAASRRHRPEPVWNREVFRAVKAAVRIPVFAVGGIRTPEQAEAILAAGEADLVGLGRPFYAEPRLAERFLAGRPAACAGCNRCVVPQMLGLPGACYDPATRRRAARGMARAPRAHSVGA